MIVIYFMLATISLIFCGNVYSTDSENEQFTAFLNKYGFQVKTPEEFAKRFGLFQKAKKDVLKYQQKYSTAKFGINKFSLMSDEELSEYTNGNPIDEPEFEVNTALSNNAAQKVSIPEYFDYRKLGKVTPVKESHSPHSCGACYAFATAAAIESQYLIHQNLNLDLSEQSLVDCDNHSSKCNGGSVKMNMNYTSQHGIPLESCYPYTAKNGTCKNICPSPRYKIAGVNRLSDKNESTYAEALFLGGPIPFWLNIPRPVLNYKSGILDFPEKECAEQSKGSHFMVLVGYTPTYWIAKNCWGRDWGEDGYMRFKRGQNFCNMTRSVFQPYL